MSWGTNVLVGQSGGPTAVINSSLAGVYEAAKALGAAHVYGMEYGIQGLLQGKIVDLDDRLDDKMEIELLKRTPSSYLGSCRFKLPNPATDERPFVQLFELFAKYCIGAVFYIGGNDSMDTIAKLSAYGAAKGSEIRFIGVPKTIDNDLMYTDHTPGYGSAAKYIATILKEVICDSSVYNIRSVTVAEIMGRHTGWLAGAASLAAGADCNGPDIILLPERPFDENVFLEKVAQLEKDRHNVIIAASEGVKNKDGVFLCDLVSTAGQLDAFGHKAILSGTSRYLADLIHVRLGCKTRAIEFSPLQRCASHLASATDQSEAFALGEHAVLLAEEGVTASMVTLTRTSNTPYAVAYDHAPIRGIANEAKSIPREWINAHGNDIRQELYNYLYPLIQGEVSLTYQNGVPVYMPVPHLKPDHVS
mgnify:FL=1